MLKMYANHFRSFFSRAILVLLFATKIYAAEWKPIAPPEDYYAAVPTACVTDCEINHKYSYIDDDDGRAVIQVKNVAPKQAAGSSYRIQTIDTNHRDEGSLQINKNLDLSGYTVPEVVFFPSALEQRKSLNAPSLIYQEVFKKVPTTFFNFKTIEKPAKVVYYGDPSLLKPKLSNDVKFLPSTGQNLGSEVKIVFPTVGDGDLKLYRPPKTNFHDDHCSVYKVSFRQDHYYQYMQYKVRMPDLTEFTICLWAMFHNRSQDHSLFSYAAKPHSKDIYMWVSNQNEPGFFNMKVLGQSIFRLNFPIKLFKWYHTCQSWNGNTGEWQVWVNSHRIARGFHNLLVGHKIPGRGIALSGQDARNFDKEFQEIPPLFQGTTGLQGQITMLQMYKVALTAGKAYNDHRHHHSHYASTTPEPPEVPTEEMPTTTEHPLLENGQLKTRVNILQLVESLKSKGQLDALENHPDFVHFVRQLSVPYASHLSPLIPHGNIIHYATLPDHADPWDHTVFKRDDAKSDGAKKIGQRKKDEGGNEDQTNKNRSASKSPQSIKVLNKISRQVNVEKVKFPTEREQTSRETTTTPTPAKKDSLERSTKPLGNEENFKDVDFDWGYRVPRTKRQNIPKTVVIPGRVKLRPFEELPTLRTTIKKPRIDTKVVFKKVAEEKKKEPTKRFLMYTDHYTHLDPFGAGNSNFGKPHLTPQTSFPYELYPQFEPDYKIVYHTQSEPIAADGPLKIRQEKTEQEVAENEVKRVMMMCSSCHPDPFRKVAVISWKSTPKKFFSGAILSKGNAECENF